MVKSNPMWPADDGHFERAQAQELAYQPGAARAAAFYSLARSSSGAGGLPVGSPRGAPSAAGTCGARATPETAAAAERRAPRSDLAAAG